MPFLIFPSKLFAEQNIARITLTSSKIQETEPGKIITASFLVYNQRAFKEEFLEELALPEGWQVITPFPESSFTLRPREQQLRIVSFSVPKFTPAATYTASYVVKNRKEERLYVREDFQVLVRAVTELELMVEEKPDIVIAADTYKVKLRLVNKSNAQVLLNINVKSVPEFPLKLEPTQATLEPNKSQVLMLEVKTDKKLTRSVDNILTISAQTEDAKTRLEKTILVKVFSRITGKLDPFHRIPAQIKLSALSEKLSGQEHTWRFQEELSGSGSLDEKGTQRVDFLLRGPDLRKIGPYGQPDQYYLNYFSRLADFHLGERSYTVSPLLEQYKYGRGLEFDLHPSRLGLGAFYLEDEWSTPHEQHNAGYISYRLKDGLTLRGNFLQKKQDATGYDDEIYSIEALLKQKELLNLDLEYGQGLSKRKGQRLKDSGLHIDMYGKIPTRQNASSWDNINYCLEYVHAGPRFFGYYNDVESSTISTDIPLSRKLRANLYYQNLRDNLDLDIEKAISDRQNHAKAGLVYNFSPDINLSLDFEDFRKEDKLLPQDYNFMERICSIGIGWTRILGKFGLQGFFEKGRFKNRLANTQKFTQRQRLYFSFNPTPKQSYSLFTEMGNDKFTDDPKKKKDFGFQALWRIFDFLHLSLSFEKMQYTFLGQEEQTRIISRATYYLPNKHSFEISNSWLKLKREGTEEMSFLLTYTIPWDIPVGKKKGIGILRGKVFDVEKGKPIPNAILTVADATAVTGLDGGFIFPALKVGVHSLWVEKRSVGLKRVTTQKTPLTVEIKEGKTTKVNIGLISASRVSGYIKLFGYKQKLSPEELASPDEKIGIGELMEIGRAANVLVEISREDEFFQQTTDSEGKFSFDNIRPGKWTLLVNEEGLASDYSIEKSEYEIEIKPGEEKEILIKALPRLRHIRILEKGELKLEKLPSKNSFRERLRRFWKK